MAGKRASAVTGNPERKPSDEIASGTALVQQFLDETKDRPRTDVSLLESSTFIKIRDAAAPLQLTVLRAAGAIKPPREAEIEMFLEKGGGLLLMFPDSATPKEVRTLERMIGLHNRMMLIGWLLGQELPFEQSDIDLLIAAIIDRGVWEPWFDRYVDIVRRFAETHPLPDETWARLARVRVIVHEEGATPVRDELEALLRRHRPDLVAEPVPPKPRPISELIPLLAVDTWAALAMEEMRGPHQEAWIELIRHAATATATNPTAKWLKEAGAHADRLPSSLFARQLVRWFSYVDQPRRDKSLDLDERNSVVLKGLCWHAGGIDTPEMARALGGLVRSAFRKVPGVGPRSQIVGNAALQTLGGQSSPAAAGQLAMLKTNLATPIAQKAAERALAAVAKRLGLPLEDVAEYSVPTYGLDANRTVEERLGKSSARLTVDPQGVCSIAWFDAAGKALEAPTPSAKKSYATEIKRLRADAEEIRGVIASQRIRLEGLFLSQKSWPLETWRELYFDHPLVGLLARRLIWRFTAGKESAAAFWRDGRFIGADDRAIAIVERPDVTVELWHPVGTSPKEVLAWRAWLERHEIRQPFKQGHREVYLLTDAEKKTRIYSNRFASHVIRRGQFQALCQVRNWRSPPMSMFDDEVSPATKALPRWYLRVEFAITPIRGRFQQPENEDRKGPAYVSTDQVRFYRVDPTAPRKAKRSWLEPEEEPLPLLEVPPIVFSEVLRDVDLFVGVCSVGNDPSWSDRGPERRFREYWESYSFGDLSETAATRKDVLTRLVPKLAIAERCSLDGKFLKVRGDLRTYKIHLGSGNILMEPNDEYLCIVAGSVMEMGSDALFLPFEGDRTLSIILSKAMLLAADKKITDTTITRQISG